MANSSDWLTALMDRPRDDQDSVKPLSLLSQGAIPESPVQADGRSKSGVLGGGFVEGLAWDKGSNGPDLRANKSAVPNAEPSLDDPLVDILREALAQGGDETEPEPEPEPEPAPEPEVQPEPFADAPEEPPEEPPLPDPIADAFAQGEEAGRGAAMAEFEAEQARKVQLRQSLRALDQAGMDALAGELAETVIALCEQTLADYVPEAESLKQRCQAAARKLGAGVGDAVLYLHPDDLNLLDQSGIEGWKVLGDPLAERGGIRFETRDGTVSDCPSDWRRAIAAAIRGDR